MNDTETTDLRRAYAALLHARTAATTAPALPLERLLDLVEGRGTETERLTTLDAAMAHEATARELELLRAVSANREAPRVLTRWRVAAPLLAAAAVLLVLIPTVTQRGVDRDPMRDARQGPTLVAPAETATDGESRTFRWHSVPGARSYSLEILTASGTPVFTTRTNDTTVTLAPDVRLAAGMEHRWWVVSELSDGTQRRSAFRRLLVRATR